MTRTLSMGTMGAIAAKGAVLLPSLLAACRTRRDAERNTSATTESPTAPKNAREAFFLTRGVVLVPDDLTLADWPRRAHAAGLTTIALHHGAKPSIVAGFLGSESGQQFLADCRLLGLQVEYELHAMSKLLPRDLFERDHSLFRMNEKGERVADANLCVHSRDALDLVAQNAVALDARLRPTTHRRFLWGDDGAPWCRCRDCAGFSDSDQALIVENAIAAALQRIDPDAQVAHLAYANTLAPPRKVTPARNVFLEFAPLTMRYERPLTSLGAPENAAVLAQLDANLAVFPRETAQALEYWLDDSMYSGWRKPAQPLKWSDDVVAADVDLYAARGLRHVTTFAVYLDADYVARYGFPDAVATYGRLLNSVAARPAGT
jgi:hypothetical protein